MHSAGNLILSIIPDAIRHKITQKAASDQLALSRATAIAFLMRGDRMISSHTGNLASHKMNTFQLTENDRPVTSWSVTDPLRERVPQIFKDRTGDNQGQTIADRAQGADNRSHPRDPDPYFA